MKMKMADQQSDSDAYFLGIMVLKGGKWSPHSKFDGGAFGSALISAEDLDKAAGVDAVKVIRIAKSGSGEQKEMWVRPQAKSPDGRPERREITRRTQENQGNPGR